MVNIDSNRLIAIILSLFSIALILLTGFMMGCGDEGDPPTDMVSEMDDPDDHDHTDHDHEQVIDVPPQDPDEPVSPVVTFKNDIFPIFAESCALAGCHVGGQPAGGLDLSDYDSFSNGGDSGAAFMADDAEGSLVVKRIDGSSPPQMPIGRDPLNAEHIQLFIDWIDNGAENN